MNRSEQLLASASRLAIAGAIVYLGWQLAEAGRPLPMLAQTVERVAAEMPAARLEAGLIREEAARIRALVPPTLDEVAAVRGMVPGILDEVAAVRASLPPVIGDMPARLASRLTDDDLALIADAGERLREAPTPGRSERWHNPANDHGGEITLLRRYRLQGRDCVEVRVRITAGAGELVDRTGNYCRAGDQQWVRADQISER